MPLVGNVEPLIEHDFAAGELRWTVFDFLMLDWHVKSMFTLTQGTFRGCYCSFNKLIQLAQVENFQATRVADLIRILPGILN